MGFGFFDNLRQDRSDLVVWSPTCSVWQFDQDSRDLAQKQTLAPAIRTIQVSREGRIKDFLAVAVGATRQFGEAEILLVGGRLLDQTFVDNLENLSGASVAIVDEANRLIAHGSLSSVMSNLPGEVFQVQTDYSYREIPLGFSDNPVVQAKVVAGFARDKMEATLQQILIGSLSAALVSVVVSFLLGLFLSKKITKPVQALVEGARRIATGDLDYRIKRSDSSEIGELVRSFNSMVGDLATYQGKLVRAERVAAWQEIARRIAHEIMNPLSPIQVSIETLRKAYSKQHPEFAEIFEESTQAILEEVAALKRIVSEFSEFARLPKPTLAMQEINPILDNVINLYRNAESLVDFVFRPGQDLPLVSVDKELMARVLSNILTNAIYAVGESGKVRIETGLRQDKVVIEIADDGIGMSPQVLAKVFTPYFTSRQNGTGLGLAIAQRIVADHDGSIEINSQQNEGTQVLLYLPIKPV